MAWPAIFGYGFYYFRTEFRSFLLNLSEISLKAGSFEASAKRAEAAAALGAAEAAKQASPVDASIQDVPVERSTRSIASTVEAVTRPTMLRKLSSAVVLWVDDRPSNNTYERRALEAMGIRFTLATSTDEALQALARESYDAVISDMGRAGDANAGLTLLQELQKRGLHVPLIVYAGTVAVKKRASIMQHGAFGSTNSPQELFELVTQAISQRRA